MYQKTSQKGRQRIDLFASDIYFATVYHSLYATVAYHRIESVGGGSLWWYKKRKKMHRGRQKSGWSARRVASLSGPVRPRSAKTCVLNLNSRKKKDGSDE